jgi:AraC-like DNA-binding protein
VGTSIENSFDDDLVLTGANLPHCWIKTAGHETAASGIGIYLTAEFFDKGWMQSREFASIRKLLDLSKRGIKFNRKIALKLKKKCFGLPNLPPLQKLTVLLEILQELSQTEEYELLCEQGFSCQINHNPHERINIVNRYIEKNYLKKISLADVAAQANMNEEYFSRFFSRVMKKSFFEFLNEYKINRACKLLIETDKTVNEICYCSGFESIPFFYRQFKKFKNYRPKQYRSIYRPGESIAGIGSSPHLSGSLCLCSVIAGKQC